MGSLRRSLLKDPRVVIVLVCSLAERMLVDVLLDLARDSHVGFQLQDHFI